MNNAGFAFGVGGLGLILLGLWMAWPPLGVIGAGIALVMTATEMNGEQSDTEQPSTLSDWG